MKHEQKLTVLTASVLAFFTACGTVGCIVSAFGLQPEHSTQLILIFGAVSFLSSLLLSFRKSGIVLLFLLALAGGYIWHDGTALRQLWQLLYFLSTIYNRAYGWGVLVLPETMEELSSFHWPLGILGCLIAMAVSRSVCRQKTAWLPVLTTILPLCTCIVVTDTVPGEPWLLMVMAALILLMLTSSVRQENAFQGLRLTATAALPVLLALTTLFLIAPQKSYVNHSETFRENILTAVRNFPQLMETGMNRLASGLRGQTQKQVDLAHLGDRISFTYPVMEVTSEKSGTLYLREQDFDQYDGLGWTASEGRRESFTSAAGQAETILIRTENRKSIRYLPYHPTLPARLENGYAENQEREQEYIVLRHHLPENWRQTAYRNSTVSSDEWQQYCALPDSSRLGAAEFLSGQYPDGASNTEKADIIAALVTNSARYDLHPKTMPEEEPDFALWFLRDGDRGYCVHFATAAAVLLRSAGVPARYVIGYMLEAQANQTVTVTEENAHAWAEYYEPNLGVWIPLEATPAAETTVPSLPQSAVPEAEETTAPGETTLPVTEATAEVTLPPEITAAEPETSPPVFPPVPKKTGQSPLLSVLLLPALALILAVQRSLRLAFRRRQQRSGDPNRQALRRWQEAVRLSRLLKESPTEELIVLAQKAKFSQHELTQEELSQFDSFNRSCLRRLKEKPIHLQLIYKYIYAAY